MACRVVLLSLCCLVSLLFQLPTVLSVSGVGGLVKPLPVPCWTLARGGLWHAKTAHGQPSMIGASLPLLSAELALLLANV